MKHFAINNIKLSTILVILMFPFVTEIYAQQNKGDETNRDYYYEASKEKLLGNFDKALELFNKALEKSPDDAASMYEIADIYKTQEKFENAVFYAEKAVQTEPDNKWYKLLLLQLYQSAGNFDDAASIIKKLIEKEPDNLEYMQDLALNYIYAGDFKEAIKTYNKLEEKMGIVEGISYQKQKIYLLQNKPEKAIEEIAKLSEANPDEIRYMELLAELYLANQQFDEALETYERIREIEPENPYINISLSDFYRKQGDLDKSFEYLKSGFANPALDIDTKVQILLAYYSMNEFYNELKDEAFTLAEILVDAHPNDPKAFSIYADLLYQDDQFEAAKEAFLKVISMDSTKYLVWEQMLFIDSELGDFHAMADESRRSIAMFPQQPLLYLFSGVANFQLDKYDKAADDLNTGVKFVVGNNALKSQFYAYLGDVYFQLEDHVKSDEAYENVLKIDPDNSIVLNNYAYYLSLRNIKLEKAERMAKKAVELDPENSANQDTYGWVLYKLGKYDQAKKWIGKSISTDQDSSAVVLEHYGDVLFKLGDVDGAIQYWEQADEAGKGSEFLKQKVKDKTLYE